MTDGTDHEAVHDIEQLALRAVKWAEETIARRGGVRAIAFFDLAGSTAAKFEVGDTAAVTNALRFTDLAESIVQRHEGRVVKTLGDGVLASFPDPVDACLAGCDLRYGAEHFLDLEIKAGITMGQPIDVQMRDGSTDILGDVVDRAARIEALAATGQVLVDETIFRVVQTAFVNHPKVRIGAVPRRGFAKGIGDIQVRELWVDGVWGPLEYLATPFHLEHSGRPALAEKLALISNAKNEIIEIGIGLTSFANYFNGQKPSEFREPVQHLIRGGVNFRCYALSETYAPGLAWLAEQGNDSYPQEMGIARDRILAEGRFCRSEGYLGRMEYYTYNRVPEFWCLGVDIDDPVNGRMFYAPYLMDIARADTPFMQVSRQSHRELFKKLVRTVNAVRASATKFNNLKSHE